MKIGTEQYIQRSHDNMIRRHLNSVHSPIHGLDIILNETDELVREYTDKIHQLLHTLDDLLENQSLATRTNENV